jgi:hypothetical protein
MFLRKGLGGIIMPERNSPSLLTEEERREIREETRIDRAEDDRYFVAGDSYPDDYDYEMDRYENQFGWY